jgi:SAM-dependent methyltransferase
MFVRKHVTASEQIRAAYDDLYAHHWLTSRTSQFSWLMRLLQPKPGRILLDVACGDAQMIQAAQKAGLVYYGVDISCIATQQANDPKVFVGDGAHLPFSDHQFDYITNVGSLEHYLDMAQGVREMTRVLKPEGRACILVPNAFGLTWNVLRAWRTGDLFDEDGQPIQRFGTRKAWRRLLTQNGLKIYETLGYERSWPSTKMEWLFYLREPREALLALLAPFLPLNMKRCFVFLCGLDGVSN